MTDSEKIAKYLERARERRKLNDKSRMSPSLPALEVPVKDVNLKLK